MQYDDFDAYLCPEAKTRLHRMKCYRSCIAARRRVTEHVLAKGGMAIDAAVLEELQALETAGRALRDVMERLQAEAAGREKDR